jgi:hypothetical protein
MKAPDPFDGFERDVNYWELPDETVELKVDGSGLPAEDRQLRFLVYAGLFDILVEALWEASEDDQERDRRLSRLLGKLQSVEPTLRFDLYEKGDLAQRTELMSRMRGKEVAVTESFLVPRLKEGLNRYEERIRALRAALGEE